jgi:acyl-CoA thioester hydrolase
MNLFSNLPFVLQPLKNHVMETESSLYRHNTSVQIRFNDVDILGHVNNAVYQHYYDFARIQYFKKVLGDSINWANQTLVLASIKVDFFSPISIDDDILVETRVEMLGNKSISMKQKLIDAKTREVKSSNRAVLVGYDAQERITFEVPDEWKNRFVSFEKSIELKYPVSPN